MAITSVCVSGQGWRACPHHEGSLPLPSSADGCRNVLSGDFECLKNDSEVTGIV